MDKKNLSILKFIKIRMVITLVMMLVIAFFFIGMAIYKIRSQFENRQSVNILGRQRMYSQMISKDALKYYINLNMLETDLETETKVAIKMDMFNAKQELLWARDQFSIILESTSTGVLRENGIEVNIENFLTSISSELSQIEEKWKVVDENIDKLVDLENNIDKSLVLYKINHNNDEILLLSNRIIDIMVNYSKENASGTMILYFFMGVILLSSIAVLLFNISRYLVLPLGELYKGMSEMGLTSFSGEVSKPTKRELEPVLLEVSDIISKFNKLIDLIENLNVNNSFSEVLEYIYKSFSEFIPYNHIGIALIDDGGTSLRVAYGISDESVGRVTSNLFGYKTDIKNTSLGRILETGATRIIDDLKEYTKTKEQKQYNNVLLESGIRSSITLPLKINNKPVGIIFFSSIEVNAYAAEHEKFLKTIANSIAVCLEKNIFVDDLLYSSILALAALADSRDNETGEHLNRMKKYSRLIATLLLEDSLYSEELNLEFINDIERFSPLHDIGKVGIRDEILLKPGKLTEEEFEIMKTHTVYGAQVLEAAESNIVKSGRSVFKLGIEIAKGHHEKWDGSGYPLGKKGLEIPLSARIVALADVLDALTSERPYKEAFSLEKSYSIINSGIGTHFDPEIVRVFMRNKDKVEELYNSFKVSC